MSELIKRSEDWLDYHKGAPWETDAMKLIAELAKRVKELEQQLQQARREAIIAACLEVARKEQENGRNEERS